MHGALEARLLPEAYLYGLAYFLGGAERRVAFLNGEQSLVGWWTYFPEAFLIKTPPALLLLLAWLAVAALPGAPLAIVQRLVPGSAGRDLPRPSRSAGNLNIGHRHLVPLYPAALRPLRRPAPPLERLAGTKRGSRLVLLAGYAVPSSWPTPATSPTSTSSPGEPEADGTYLLDSNLDWGQDLARLGRWMERNGVEEIDLAYFGTADPEAYGIRYRKILMVHDFHPERPPSVPHRAGSWRSASICSRASTSIRTADSPRRCTAPRLDPTWTRSIAGSPCATASASAGAPPPGFRELGGRPNGSSTKISAGRRSPRLLSPGSPGCATRSGPLARVGDSIFIYRAP